MAKLIGIGVCALWLVQLIFSPEEDGELDVVGEPLEGGVAVVPHSQDLVPVLLVQSYHKMLIMIPNRHA